MVDIAGTNGCQSCSKVRFLAVFVGGCEEVVFLVLSAEQNVGIGLIYYLGAGVWEERVRHGVSLGVLRCRKVAHTKALSGILFPMFSVSLLEEWWAYHLRDGPL